MKRRGRLALSFGLILIASISPAEAGDLSANDLLLVYNSRSTASRQLAEHYSAARSVPPDLLLGIDMPLRESITAKTYEEIAATVRRFIQQRSADQPILCLVTFYDVPLKISAIKQTKEQRKRQDELRKLRGESVTAMEQLLQQAGETKEGHPAASEPNATTALEMEKRYHALRRKLVNSLAAVELKNRGAANRRFLEFVAAADGTRAALSIARSSFERYAASVEQSSPQIESRRKQIGDAEGQYLQARKRLRIIRDEGPLSDKLLPAIEDIRRVLGLLDSLKWLERDIERLSLKESHAAFDSELSLVLWKNYGRYRWQPNLLSPEVRVRFPELRRPPVMMVSRLDAPTPKIVRRMIDDAVAVERVGLSGKCYFDTRPLKKNDAYRRYNLDLMRLFHLVRDKTDLPARVHLGPGVFPRGSCDDAALYCGWYSLAKYVPAFTFRRGAVAAHIASFEMISLRSKTKNYWCAGLLYDGVAATFGPTAEPYLESFPSATRFFGLLLTGETLVECFYETSPFLSWQQVLLGDPLYRPFAKNPKLTLDELNPPDDSATGVAPTSNR